VKRQFPNPKEIFGLVKFRKRIWNRTKRKLSRVHTIEDLRILAKKRTPRGPFDYVEGGAEAEITLKRNVEAFNSISFIPRVLKDVSRIDTSASVFGHDFCLPMGFAPTGYTRMMHAEGELAVSKVAEKFVIPFVLSTMGTTSIKDIVSHSPHGTNWFQLYLWKDRNRSLEFIKNAKASGVDTLILTVDVPVTSRRLRDVRNGLTIPTTLNVKTFANTLTRFSWLADFLTTESFDFASFKGYKGTVADLSNSMFDPSNAFDDLKWLRMEWHGKLIVKGIQHMADVRNAINCGADAIWLSNHGGRQLDRSRSSLAILTEMTKEFGKDVDFHFDGGVRSGSDVAAALACGAKFVWIGRAYLYGLMAAGELGVEKAMKIIQEDLIRTMSLLGASSISELTADHIQLT
jgi:L-lactate dehydrogenase (cytochrome)